MQYLTSFLPGLACPSSFSRCSTSTTQRHRPLAASASGSSSGGSSGISSGKFLREAMRQPVSGTTQVYADAAEYLKGLGMTKQEELTRVLDLAMNPASLYAVRSRKRGLYNPAARQLSVDGDIRPVVECLLEAGFSQEQIVRIVSEHPPVLCYSVAGRLRPWLASLAGLGVSQAQVVVLVERRPTVLGIEESQLLRIVGWLRESGKDIPEIADLLGSSI